MPSAMRINPARALIAGVLALLVLLLVLAVRPGGIGGTGIGDGNGNGGIGGTGIGTGFIGRIDAFGSIWVNGEEIFYDPDIPVQFGGLEGDISDLKIGHVVQVVAHPDKSGVLQATRLSVRFAVVGEVQSVTMDTATIFDEPVIFPANSPRPKPGEMLAVSGFQRSDGTIIASRIDTVVGVAPVKAVKLDMPFAGQVETLSLSGYVHKETDGYSLYGYRFKTVPEDFSTEKLSTLEATQTANALSGVTIRQVETPILQIPDIEEPAPEPIKVPVPKRLQTPKPVPKQQSPEKPKKTPPIKPQPIRQDQPEIIKPERSVVPVKPPVILPKRQEVQPVEAPLQRIEEEMQTESEQDPQDERTIAPDNNEEADTQDTPERATSEDTETDATTAPERPDTDVPDTPERDTRPETPTRPGRTDRPQRPERVERPERPDRPERPERPDRPR